MIVKWTDGALADILAIRNYVAQFSSVSADGLADRITRRADQIGQFPLSGRKIDLFDLTKIREIYEGRYRIVYHIAPDRVNILAVLHTSLNLLRDE